MEEIILITPDQLRQIVTECLANQKPDPAPKPQSEKKLLYSVKELSAFLNCSPVTCQKLKNSGRIRFKQFGRKCVFDTSEILEDLAARTKKTGK